MSEKGTWGNETCEELTREKFDEMRAVHAERNRKAKEQRAKCEACRYRKPMDMEFNGIPLYIYECLTMSGPLPCEESND